MGRLWSCMTCLVLFLADVVEKLSSSGRQIDAVHFVCEFGLAEKIPPVPLLKAYLKEAKRAWLEITKNDKNGAGTTMISS